MFTHKEIKYLYKYIRDSKSKLAKDIIVFINNSKKNHFKFEHQFKLQNELIIETIKSDGTYLAYDSTVFIETKEELSDLCIEDLLAIYDYINEQINEE